MPFSLTNFLAINTPSYKLAKSLVSLLTPFTLNSKCYIPFAKEVPSFDCAHYLTSYDVKSLFINIPLQEIINICVDKLWKTRAKVNNLTKESF